MRSQGWLAVAAATVLTACSGGGGAGGALPPATSTTNNSPTLVTIGGSSSARVVECHLGGGGGNGGGNPTPTPAPETTLQLCNGWTGAIDAVNDGTPIVAVTVADTRVLRVSADASLDRSYPWYDGAQAAWYDVAALAVGTTTVAFRDARGRTGSVIVKVENCGPVATPTPTTAPTATPSPTPSPTPTPVPTAPPTPVPTPSPTATPTPTPTPSACGSSSNRQSLGSRHAMTGVGGGC